MQPKQTNRQQGGKPERHSGLEIKCALLHSGRWTTMQGRRQVEVKQKAEDDTGLNGIRLHCLNKTDIHPNVKDEYIIKSTEGPWGEWSQTSWCPIGHLISFSMQVEPPRRGVDDTAANNLMFQCSDYEIILGAGHSWGDYGRWSGKCMDGICGMKAKVERPQGSGDDTALNDVQFICCKK
ncbi:vitelline membrane outer layer protein 1-like isoform X2 [Phyllobates terribilis]|uniref:vitelline membrane outer layer protein 1-like isoform X2 n=1 Tax=Phyllobates terribilis TaxID=111132 RepID=UPI003CCA72C2